MSFIFDDPSVKPYEFLTNGILDLHVKVYCLTACDASEKCSTETSVTSLNFNQLESNWLGNCWNKKKTKNFFWWSCLWRCSLPLHHHTWIYFHILKPNSASLSNLQSNSHHKESILILSAMVRLNSGIFSKIQTN